MATTPSFASTPMAGAVAVSATQDTSFTAPTAAVTVVGPAGTNGAKIDEVTCQGIGSTAQGIITIFLFDGTNYHLYDQFAVATTTTSTTVPVWRQTKTYSNLVLPSGWSLRAASTVASQNVSVAALGGSF